MVLVAALAVERPPSTRDSVAMTSANFFDFEI